MSRMTISFGVINESAAGQPPPINSPFRVTHSSPFAWKLIIEFPENLGGRRRCGCGQRREWKNYGEHGSSPFGRLDLDVSTHPPHAIIGN